jgi:hypothetical protein
MIAECSSSEDRTLVNHSYRCMNHCLEQLIRFCDEASFLDPEEEMAIRKLYRKFNYPIVPWRFETASLLHLFDTHSSQVENDELEVLLTGESSTLEKVQFYIHHLKILLKTSDQQHISTVPDFDDALLQFASFISNGKEIVVI